MEASQAVRIITSARAHTSSFVLLHDNHSSAAELRSEIETALKPVRIKKLLEGVRFVVPDAPFIVRREIADSASEDDGKSDGSEAEFRWFTAIHAVGADDGATLHRWKQLSVSMGGIDEIVQWEAAAVGRENVFIMGFGMGFAAAVAYVLQMEDPIGGLLGVYPWMPFHEDLKSVALHGETVMMRERMRRQYDKRKKKDEEEEEEEGSSDDDEFSSGSSTPTLCADDADATTSEAMLKRVMGFFNHLASRGEPPVYKRVCERIDTCTPVILVHGVDDEDVNVSCKRSPGNTPKAWFQSLAECHGWSGTWAESPDAWSFA